MLVLVTSGAAALSCIVGATFGAWAGILQAKSLRTDAERFRDADTALEVRRIMMTSRAGKRAIILGWLSAVLLFVPAAMSDTMVLVFAKWFAGYFTLKLVRDIITYPALRYVVTASSGRP